MIFLKGKTEQQESRKKSLEEALGMTLHLSETIGGSFSTSVKERLI